MPAGGINLRGRGSRTPRCKPALQLHRTCRGRHCGCCRIMGYFAGRLFSSERFSLFEYVVCGKDSFCVWFSICGEMHRSFDRERDYIWWSVGDLFAGLKVVRIMNVCFVDGWVWCNHVSLKFLVCFCWIIGICLIYTSTEIYN